MVAFGNSTLYYARLHRLLSLGHPGFLRLLPPYRLSFQCSGRSPLHPS